MNELSQEFLKLHGARVFNQSKNARDWVENIWRESNAAYNSKFSAKEREQSAVLLGQSRLFIPKTYNTVQRILTEIMETFFFDPDEIVSVTSSNDIPMESRQAVKALLNYRLNGHPICAYSEFYEAAIDGLKNKIGILKVYPKLRVIEKEKGRRKVKDEAGVETEIIDTEKVVDAFEPRIECLPPEDVFIDPEATWKDYWKYPIVHRIVRTRDELKRSGFKNLDAVSVSNNIAGYDMTKADRSPELNDAIERDVKGQERIFAYEIWTFLDINGDGKLESVVYHMLGDQEGPKVIGKEAVENTLPYRFSEFDPVRPPFVIGSPFPEPHKMYGKDLPEFTAGLQKEINALRNQDREAAALSIRKPLLVNRDAGVDMMALVNRKIGAPVLADDTGSDAVRELQTSNPVINTAPVSARIDQDYFEATSITPGQLGVSVRDETATAVSAYQNNANKKIQNIVRNLAYTLFKPSAVYLLRLEQAYESDAFIQKVTGQVLGWRFPNDGAPSWQKIQGDFDLNVEFGVNKQSQLNRYLLMMDRMNQSNASMLQLMQAGVLPPENAKLLNPLWAFRRASEVLKHKNVDEMFIQASPPVPQSAPKGIASQPRNVGDPAQQVGQINPEALSDILG